MIPAIALMIAVYGTARLLNDALARSASSMANTLTWCASIVGIGGLWFLALSITSQGLPQ